ncbi:MAG: hypothetical protein AAGC71_05120 [Pseudomonadota bacterium]
MTKRRLWLTTALVATLSALPANAAEIVREFSGNRDMTTLEFEVSAPWILDWRIGSEFPDATRFELWIVDAMTGHSKSRVMKLKKTGSGKKLFLESGRLRFRVSASFANWYLKVSEITEKEANDLVELPKPWQR